MAIPGFCVKNRPRSRGANALGSYRWQLPTRYSFGGDGEREVGLGVTARQEDMDGEAEPGPLVTPVDGGPTMAQALPKKQKTGACHKCSGVIKQEAKATVCPKCSCRRALLALVGTLSAAARRGGLAVGKWIPTSRT